MKRNKFFLSIAISFLFCLHANSQNIDSIACKKVEDTLMIIKNFLMDTNSDPQLNRISAITFLIELSKIPYEGQVTFIGTEFPSKNFYTKCKEWYVANKKKLAWNVKQNKIVVME